MDNKEYHSEIARKIAAAPFWRMEYLQYISESFTMEMPYPPPGMPNYFDSWESTRCFEWLSRTVKSWVVSLEAFYSTPDPNQFWAVGDCGGRTFWNNQDGHFHSKLLMRVEMKDGLVDHIVWLVDPLSFLKAAGLEAPVLHKGIHDPEIDAFLADHPEYWKQGEPRSPYDREKALAAVDLSPEACEKRKATALAGHFCARHREEFRNIVTSRPDVVGGVWFLPDDRPWASPNIPAQFTYNNEPPLPSQIRVQAWLKASSPWMYRDPRGVIYQTDDENVYFVETLGHGPGKWIGNGCDNGHYHQRYFMYLQFDQYGRIAKRVEVLNPIYKLSSVNISMPIFPYYL